MSTAGQLGGGLVGGIAGFLLTGGSLTGGLYGAQIGLGIGGYLDPAPGPTTEGPRLSDRSVQTSTYGAVIPRIYGAAPVAGNLIWLQGNAITETITKTKKGGKGGGSKTTTVTYSYSATCAFALADARAHGAPFIGIRRIWTSQGLYYDAGSSDPDTIAASNDAAAGFTFYPGSDTQLPDPSIQADIGAANTPAYRGLAYIVFNDLPLAAYGNSLAGLQLKVELMVAAEPLDWSATAHTLPASDSWGSMAASDTTAVCVAGESLGSNRIAITHDGQAWSVRTTTAIASRYCVAHGAGVFIAMRYGDGCDKSTDDGETWASVASVSGRDWVTYPSNAYPPYSPYSYSSITYGGGSFCAIAGNISGTTADGINWQKGAMPSNGDWHVAYGGATFCAVKGSTSSAATSIDGRAWTARTMAASGSWGAIAYGAGLFVAVGFAGGIQTSPDGVAWTVRTNPGYNYKSIVWNSDHFVAIGYGSANAVVSADGITWSAISLPSSQLWRSGVSFLGSVVVSAISSAAAAYITVSRVGAAQPLSEIVSAECLQAGLLTSSDIDVTALTSDVRGYRIGSLGTIRAALEPLRASWPFDVVQDGYGIRFTPRGGASVVTIPAADLDARPAGESPGAQITTAREMDSQLPRRIEINFLDVDREYDAGLQYDERLNTAATNLETIDLPIVLAATEAAGKAQVLLYQRWLDRYTVGPIRLPSAYAGLQPADVVSLTTEEGLVDLRLTGINYTADNRLEITGKYSRPAIYTPTAVGAAGQATGVATLTPIGASIYQLLDIPLVTDVQAVSGFVAAMYGAKAGWQGGVLMQSTDAGANWSAIDDFGPPGATIGAATNTIGTVESRLIDKASRLTVVLANGELSSTTELAMLGGANHFAYGAHGRWEVIAAQTCTLQSGSTYILSNLLRGRFGTEQHMSAHLAGDIVALLDADDASFIPMSSGSIGLARDYRGITINRDISTDSNHSFTYNAVNLKPLAPIALTGNRHPATNDWALTWLRRTRSGGEWRDYVDADLGETSEQYQIDIHADGSYTAVKRTLTVTSQSAAYTSADQVTDFGSNQGTLYLKIYQLSPTVGRGYPLTASITR